MSGRELIVDSFAGGGGASTGIEIALGRSPDYAINHDAEALALHAANHPATVHLSKNIWQVDPLDVVKRDSVGLAWFSPDCKHFSKAKGGKPVQKNIRDLAWVVVLWAQRVRPRVIIVENVEEFRGWGPLAADGRPCPDGKGATFAAWLAALRKAGYRAEHRELRACDYGAPTIRRRLFVIARRDGERIVWPAASHGAPDSADVIAGRLKPWRTAAEIIDWARPCPSIFDTADQIMAKYGVRSVRPLAENTLRRIARGVVRYVLEHPRPFIIQTGYGERRGQAPRVPDIDAPIGTQVAGACKHAVIAPHLMMMRGSQKPWTAADEPMHTITAGGAHPHLVAAFLAQHNTGLVGHHPGAPVSTIINKGCTQAVVAAHLATLRGECVGAPVDAPLGTVTAGGNHAALIAPFLSTYYGSEKDGDRVDAPLRTETTRDRFGLVTVTIDGACFVITDIGMRMLTTRERFRAQGFPDAYRIETGVGPDGAEVRLSGEAQGRMCGNSVCPPLAAALVGANVPEMAVERIAA